MFSLPQKLPRIRPAESLSAVVGIALACSLSFWLVKISGRRISPMWPATGVTMAFFVVYGRRALLPAMAGHLIVLKILTQFSLWPVLLIPVLYPLEAWLVSWLAGLGQQDLAPGELDLRPDAWRHVGAPLIGCIPLAVLMSLLLTWSGRYSPDAKWGTMILLMMSHVHGIVTFGPLSLHLLRRDFILAEVGKYGHGILAGGAALVVMELAFLGTFSPFVSPESALYLPFPLLIMAAVSLPPAPISLLMAIWCVVATALNCLGSGPFVIEPGSAGSSMNSAELGIYNMTMVTVTYLVSIGSFRLLQQLRLNGIAMEAARIDLWEWQEGKAIAWVRATRPTPMHPAVSGPNSATHELCRLAGAPQDPLALPDSWQLRIRTGSDGPSCGSGETRESIGRILDRGRDGRPIRAIGLLKDVSMQQKTEAALVALGYQKARLRDLQSKLNPHFLFNSLNIIRALVHIDTKCADDAIISLAGLLRSSLRKSDHSLITLGEELKSIRELLHLATLRFGNRLRTTIEVPEALMEVQVPPMLLLNLVENAITHGVGKLEEGGVIEILAKARPDHVGIHVRNSGTLLENSVSGIGIRDALQRLELIFGGKAAFSLSQMNDTTVSADIRLPVPELFTP